MEIKKELMYGKGFAVISIENMDLFKKLRDAFIEKINTSNEQKDISLQNITLYHLIQQFQPID